MTSPRSGLRRARATSWALAGLGIAGIAATSTLAYADTFKPPAAEVPVVEVGLTPQEVDPLPAPDLPPALVVAPDPAPPVVIEARPSVVTESPPESAVEKAPVTRATTAPDDTPQQTYQPAPVPSPSVTSQSQVPKTPPITKRRNLTSTTVLAPGYSPHVSVSRGS